MPRNIQFKVGLFIIITSVMILSFVGYVAYKKGFFTAQHTYTLSSKSGDNLTEGMPVLFSGFKIGRVDSLELNDEGLVLIKIKVMDRHIKWIRSDSVFILEKPLIGSPRIYVVTANLHSPALSETSVTAIDEVDDINDAIKSIKPILKKISSITDNIENLVANLADPGGDMTKILSNTRNATEKADGILKKVDAMAAKTDEQIYGSQGVLAHVQVILKDLIAKLRKMDPVLDNIHKISGDTAETTRDLKFLRQDIERTVNDINVMVNDIDKLIPLKKDTQLKLP
jgi:phospholipid/cholesterol/gamma-HCH transport system substrate-binding protein